VHEPDLEKEANMGLFDKKKKTDFSDVQSGSSSTAPRQHRQAPAGSRYTVQKGDTLSAIAKREYGNPNEWRRIYEANRDQIDDPDLIQPGQQLTIPGKTEQGGYR
jgi:nucleoid-associated protein YgaU